MRHFVTSSLLTLPDAMAQVIGGSDVAKHLQNNFFFAIIKKFY